MGDVGFALAHAHGLDQDHVTQVAQQKHRGERLAAQAPEPVACRKAAHIDGRLRRRLYTAAVAKKGEGNFDELFNSGDTWVVD